MLRRTACFALVLAVLPAAPALAQTTPLAEPLIAFVNAASGVFGDEGPRLAASLDGLDAALAAWDSAVRRAEAGLAADIRSAAPPAAAQMLAAIGAVYLQRGRLADAVRQLHAAAALTPDSAQTQLLLAVALERGGESGAAHEAWHRALQAIPDPSTAYLYARSAGEGDDALKTAQDLLVTATLRTATVQAIHLPSTTSVDDDTAVDPVFLPAIYGDAVHAFADADYAAGLRALRVVSARDPLATDAATHAPAAAAGIAALRSGDIPGALRQLHEAAAQAPRSSEMHRVLAMGLWADQQIDAARAEFESAIGLRADDERSYMALVDIAVDEDDLDGATAVLTRAAAAVPRSGQAWWRLGQIAERQHHDAEALAAYERCAAVPPIVGAGRVYAAIGRLRLARPDLDAATSAYRRWTALQPNVSAAHRAMSDVLRTVDRNGDALLEQLAATLLEPRNAAGYAGIAQIMESLERDDEAEQAARRALALDSTNREARYTLSVVLARRGRRDESARELEAFTKLQADALAAERRTFTINSLKLQAQVAAGPRERAAAWQRIVDAERPTADNERHLGDALAADGRLDDAVTAYRMAASLGGSPAVHRALIAVLDTAGRRGDADAARAEFDRMKRDRIRRLGAAQ